MNALKFKIQEKLEQNYQYYVYDLDDHMIDVMADILTEEQYHELCHQLYGTKAEFDEIDGECEPNSRNMTKEDRYRYTVKSGISRGIFWDTLKRLNDIEENDDDLD